MRIQSHRDESLASGERVKRGNLYVEQGQIDSDRGLLYPTAKTSVSEWVGCMRSSAMATQDRWSPMSFISSFTELGL